jgi:pyridoxamine 5'-phosphate oxidase
LQTFLNNNHIEKTMSLPPWRSIISGALHRNRSLPASRYLQLATVNQQNRPANRTVVFRGWRDPESQLQFVTDARSAKATEISHNPWAEACWYFSKTREQFRITGELQLIDIHSPIYQPERQAAWEKMSDAGKVQFYWPQPGADRIEDEFAEAEITAAPPTDFCLLLLSPTMVDRLELRGNPQTRSRYCLLANQQWSIESINP